VVHGAQKIFSNFPDLTGAYGKTADFSANPIFHPYKMVMV